MLKITLYENCILNDDYDEVFSVNDDNTNSTLERYLSTLRYRVIELDTVYQENSGTLVFDMIFEPPRLKDIYHYNYMKVETISETPAVSNAYRRYCFIDRIRLKNDVVYLDYSEDIWSSYASKITGITNSFLGNSRIVEYKNNHNLKFRTLPLEFGGNDSIYQNIEQIFSSKRVAVIAEIQYYSLVEEGQPTERQSNLFLLETSGNPLTSIEEAVRMCAFFEQRTQIVNGLAIQEGETWYSYSFQINKYYFIPEEIFNTDLSQWFNATQDMRVSWSVIYRGKSLNYQAPMRELLSRSFQNNFYRKSFGTLSTQIQLVPNGTSINLKILISACKTGLRLYMDINEQITEITDDFVFELPYSYFASEVVAQQKINHDTKSIANSFKDFVENLNLMRGANKTISGVGQAIGSGYSGSIGGIFRGVETAINGTLNIAESIGKKDYLNKEREIINREAYNTSVKSICKSDAIVNAQLGLIFIRVSPDNEDIVKETINYTGFKTYELFNDYEDLGFNDGNEFLNRNVPINFNAVKFLKVNVYGRFPSEIANKLEEILLGGTVIWFDENRSTDNYLSQVL